MLTESTRFFPSLFQYILPLPLSTEKLFFLCSFTRTHNHLTAHNIHSFIRRDEDLKNWTFSFSILSPGIIGHSRLLCSSYYSRKISLRATCWLAFNFSFLPLNNSTNVLDIHTRDDGNKIASGKKSEKWKIRNRSERCELRAETQRARGWWLLILKNINFLIRDFSDLNSSLVFGFPHTPIPK